MLIDTHKTMAFKCSYCGDFHFIPVKYFELMNKGESVYRCGCNQSSIRFSMKSSLVFSVEMPCMGCGQSHVFYLSARKIMNSPIISVFCPVTGMEQMFIGNDEEVRKALDEAEKKMDELADSLGYDSYFKNSRVMLQTLNRIHEIAEEGNMICECGSREIDLSLLPDRILLRCCRCNTYDHISASNSGELRKTLDRLYIILSAEDSTFHNA